eukprot:CAMPEP_0119000990 /NCGR_PEP_ID=MMETSP1173-20130426/64353_1 /TAXON_ID=1034831 /ORGANISM="Rhizochromulina marina cf, Strain CCMP1243" /LENGTH=1550 /DNA_ID=CAMNT_0006952493 /DNA_START=19 /DNA_END=4671 /DNA_ORIENTATION=+
MDLQHPPSLKRVQVYRPAPLRRAIFCGLAVAMYAVVLPQVYTTMGQPRATALAQIEKIETMKPPEVSSSGVWVGGKLVDEAPDEFSEEVVAAQAEEGSAAKDTSDDWRKAFEGAGKPQEIRDEEGRPLPSPYLPSAMACVGLFLSLTVTALFFLLCHWLVSFKAFALYEPAQQMQQGCFVLVLPQKHRGKAAICAVKLSSATRRLGFDFQRQRYEFVDARALDYKDAKGNTVGRGEENGAVVVVACPVNLPVRTYAFARGLGEVQVQHRQEQYGRNVLRIPTPKVTELLKQQLLSPIAIFQIFCAVLWMLDEYWQYTIFTLFSIVALEATTVFQRLKTFSTLGGMASKPTPLHVFRDGAWAQLTTEDLLPGDLISLSRKRPQQSSSQALATSGGGESRGKRDKGQGKASAAAPGAAGGKAAASLVIPCDLILLTGSAVVNEASLTGESVPQMKDSLTCDIDDEAEASRRLDIEGRDRVHTLFSGTNLVVSTPPSSSSSVVADEGGAAAPSSSSDVLTPPDGGCLCYVLRTGFSSSQGELMQMIEFSTQQVSADSKETGLALLVLLCFALASAGYVLKKGLEKGDRTTHELLLKCVIIITSVVPRQLPVQMAMAVNTALMALMKAGIFCTEPFRVPFAGKISHCLFDKTGTLTTDQLVPVGVVNHRAGPGTGAGGGAPLRVEVKNSGPATALVLGACHSLVEMEGVGVIGDPIEIAALRGVEWRYDAGTQTSRPGNLEEYDKAIKGMEKERDSLAETAPSKKKIASRIEDLRKSMHQAKQRADACPVVRAVISRRFHFSSELQRMSVVADVHCVAGSSLPSARYCLVKGSPEAIKNLLREGEKPTWYDEAYNSLAEEGMRVLALAYKQCGPLNAATSGTEDERRGWVESDLLFAGFIAFTCKTRSDSPTVIKALIQSSHEVSMLTGDAPLTALHVAKKVGLCSKPGPPLTLERQGVDGGFQWAGMLARDRHVTVPFDAAGLGALSESHDLVVLESVLEEAGQAHGDAVWEQVAAIRVFARCSPHGKAKVIRFLQRQRDHHVLMCGDGGNDVGALKQADVGLALLSGYGNANTTDDAGAPEANAIVPGDAEGAADGGSRAEDELNAQAKKLDKRSKEAAKVRKALLDKKRQEIMKQQQTWIQEELQRRQEAGLPVGPMGMMEAVKKVSERVRQEMTKEAQALNRKYGNVFDSTEGENADPLQGLDDATVPIVRPGDASVAAPFTSRIPSIRSVVNLIRQGRCTLLSALQQQQIMMLECIISAYALSALSLEGARSSERQMMASGWLIMTASLAFSYTRHIEEMHPVRPLRSLFHPAIFLSMLGQATIHVLCMWYGVQLATKTMGPELLKEVLEFHKKAKARELPEQQANEDDPWAEIWNLWQTPFKPNLLNTVVFLVETSQMIAVLFVNYKGRPWMKGILENHPLFLSVFLCVAGVAGCAWGISPQVNELIHLAPFPDDAFRWQVLGLVGASLVGTFIWDRVITALFAPRVFGAMVTEAKKTTWKDLVPVVSTAGKVAVGFAILATGNILLLGGIGYWYYMQKKKREQGGAA